MNNFNDNAEKLKEHTLLNLKGIIRGAIDDENEGLSTPDNTEEVIIKQCFEALKKIEAIDKIKKA